jgi:hypothetical protein
MTEFRSKHVTPQLDKQACAPLSSFPDATEFFFLPTLQCAKDCVFCHRTVWLSFEILLSVWGSKTRFGFSDSGPRGIARTSAFFCVFG